MKKAGNGVPALPSRFARRWAIVFRLTPLAYSLKLIAYRLELIAYRLKPAFASANGGKLAALHGTGSVRGSDLRGATLRHLQGIELRARGIQFDLDLRGSPLAQPHDVRKPLPWAYTRNRIGVAPALPSTPIAPVLGDAE